MVSPWMSNGDTFTYITKNPHVDRKPIVRSPLLTMSYEQYVYDIPFQIRRIAEGLALLHNRERPIIHGDIKAVCLPTYLMSYRYSNCFTYQANILINDEGQPVLADFGLSKASSISLPRSRVPKVSVYRLWRNSPESPLPKPVD